MTQQKQINKIEYSQVSELCDFRKGKKVNSTKEKTKNSVPYLLIDTLRGAEPEFFTEDKNYTEAIPDDILIVADGANSGLVGTGVSGAVGSTILRIRLKVKDLDKDYLSYFLKSKFEEFNKDMKGTGIPHLKPKNMLESKIRKPSLSEQTLIVQEIEKQFTRLDSAVKALKSVKQKLEVYRKAVLKKAFEKKEGWEEKTLKEACDELFAGGDLPKGNWSKERTEEFQIPIYANGIKDKGLYGYTNIIRTDKKCVTVSARGTIGHTEIREEPFYPIVRLLVAIPKKDLDYKYLKYLLDFMDVKGNGISIPQLTIPKIKLEIVYFPFINEQSLIVQSIESKFSVIDKIEQIINQSLSKAEKLRKSILKSAFEGKLVKT